MGKLIKFPEKDNPISFFKETLRLVEDAEKGDDPITSIVVAMQLKTGEWVMGYHAAGFEKRLEAMSQINCDVIDMMIQNNAERYGLHTHED